MSVVYKKRKWDMDGRQSSAMRGTLSSADGRWIEDKLPYTRLNAAVSSALGMLGAFTTDWTVDRVFDAIKMKRLN